MRIRDLKFLRNLIALEMRAFGRKTKRFLGIDRPLPVDVSELAVPDGSAARTATELVSEISSPELFRHCLRTWMFGEILGRRHNLKYDPELLYLGAVLHDLGLTELFDGVRDFETEGADAARRVLLDNGVASEKADIVHAAVALHTSAGIAEKQRPEIALVHFGAGMDVFGFHAEDFHPETVERVFALYPRVGFTVAVTDALREQAHRKPDSRIARLVRFGFLRRVERAPFAACHK